MSDDLKLVKQLEKEIGRNLVKRDIERIIESNQQGYALDEHKNVVGLNLSGFKLLGLPKSLSFFRHLEKLRLSGNNLNDFSGLEDLSSLSYLHLANNHINTLSGLESFVNLSILRLNSNQLRSLSGIEGLKKLTKLDLRNNKIKLLPETIVDLGMRIDVEIEYPWGIDKGIFLHGNPLESPPIEIIKKGNEAIRQYFKFLAWEQQTLNEVKVLLVGDGAAGKTSLAKALLGEPFDINESKTHGININTMENYPK
jgi:Leucine-rich repeat (LRR) protein